jgi:phosphate acetyltransferase
VVHPCSADALAGAVAAAEAGLIVPVLFGPEAEIRQIADHARLDLGKCRIVATDGPEDSALKAAMAAGAGEVAALMKGSLHSDQLLHAVMQKEAKLRTGRTISHCAMMSVPTYARRFIISDVALNIAPDTDQKRDICQNAVGHRARQGILWTALQNNSRPPDERAPLTWISAVEAYFRDDPVVPNPQHRGR